MKTTRFEGDDQELAGRIDEFTGRFSAKNLKLAIVAVQFVLITAALSVSGLAAEKKAVMSCSADYGEVLGTYVNDKGMVNYKELKVQPRKLDTFIHSLAETDRKDYAKWTDKAKIAFRINAYNALTLKAVIDNYPIKSSFFRALRFPKNSIRQIPGVWDELKFTVMDKPITLDGIEHDILRKRFNEPRIHMALVCAAMGCPPLRKEPYTAESLDAQLDDQTIRFLGNSRKFRIDREQRTVYLSSIFKWFGDDFVKTYGTDEKFSGYSDSERAVLNFLNGFLKPNDKAFLEKGGYSIDYLDYDWSLNEQKS